MARYTQRKTTVATNNKKNISLVKNPKIFAIMLNHQETLADIQEKAGMKGAFKTEWQYHYWSAVGEIIVEDESLSIVIPLVYYNYPQEVAHSSVDWKVEDVQTRAEELRGLANQEFIKMLAAFGQDLTEKYNLTWTLVPTNNVHAHPSGIGSFSGVDCDTSTIGAGIVHIYEKTEDRIPYMSSLMHHSGHKNEARWVHSKFKVFTGDVTTKAVYEEGRAIHYVRDGRIIEEGTNGVISALFGAEEKPVVGEDYMLKDNLSKEQGNTVLAEILELFDSSKYLPSTEHIIKEHIKKKTYSVVHGRGRHDIRNTYYQQTAFGWDDEIEEDFSDLTAIEFTMLPLNDKRSAIFQVTDHKMLQINGFTSAKLQKLYEEYIEKKKKEEKPEELTEAQIRAILVREGQIGAGFKAEEGELKKLYALTR